jgi:hypothetical protein
MSKADKWDPHFYQRNRILASLAPLVTRSLSPLMDADNWPTAVQINQLWQQPVLSGSGRPYEFVAQTPAMERDGFYYEQRIFLTGQIPTRERNWHDLFNALIWAQFPNSKAIINQQHHADIQQFGLNPRSERRNALTLFDECGVLIACCDPELKRLLRTHSWQQAFWDCRARWGKTILPVVFGHALYEMALTPFLGLCGKALFVDVTPGFFEQRPGEQVNHLDLRLADALEKQDLLAGNQPLSPFPILGVPGYDEANCRPEYYQNTDYFRPKRKA